MVRQRYSPLVIYGLPLVFITAGSTLGLIYSGFSGVPAYLMAINITTFVFYGYDKLIAGTKALRVPEILLHVMALCGGSPMALLSQQIFRHKTGKPSFQRLYWVIVMFQILLVLAYFKM